MKKRYWQMLLLLVALVAVFWLSGLIPRTIARHLAARYMEQQPDGDQYVFEKIEFSTKHDVYFVYYRHRSNDSEALRCLSTNGKYLPTAIDFDSYRPRGDRVPLGGFV